MEGCDGLAGGLGCRWAEVQHDANTTRTTTTTTRDEERGSDAEHDDGVHVRIPHDRFALMHLK